jgi:hypothetical protein
MTGKPRLDRNDVFRAATSRMGLAEGVTRPGVGTILYRGGVVGQRWMVAEHERLHAELNGCNSFGLLLSEVGQRSNRNEPGKLQLLEGLIDLCRTTHEVYATSLSVWQVPLENRAEALTEYPDYHNYLRMGEIFSGGYPPESMVARALVVAACVIAMQVPLGLAINNRKKWDAVPVDIGAKYRPDERLAQLLDCLPKDLSWVTRDVDARWHRASKLDPYGSGSFKRAYHRVLIQAYHQMGWALKAGGIPVLPWDAHLRYRLLEDLLGDTQTGSFTHEHLAADEVSRLGAATDTASNAFHGIRSSERQSVRRTTYGGTLIVAPVVEIESVEDFLSYIHSYIHPKPTPNFHIVARPVESLISAYDVSDEHATTLRSMAIGGVLTALRTVVSDGGRWVTFLAVMPGSAYLQLLLTMPVADDTCPPTLVSTIAASCLFSSAWRDEWVTALRVATCPVLLFDWSPSLYLAAFRDPDGIDLAIINVQPGEISDADVLHALLMGRRRAPEAIERYVAFIGSEVMIRNLALRLCAVTDASMDNSVLSLETTSAILRLASEEPEFNFSGHEYFEPANISEPIVRPGELARWRYLHKTLQIRRTRWRFAHKPSPNAGLV